MTVRLAPRLFTIAPGARFLPELAEAVLDGRLIAGFPGAADPLALADATIYVPTRRAARALRATFANRAPAHAAILPSIRPLGEFEEDLGWFDDQPGALALDPPIDALERRLRLAPLVRKWKERLPGHIARKFAEGVVVPATTADALWLADDLARLIDEVETEGASWDSLASIAVGQLAGWWEVTLDFLKIVTESWPQFLAASGRSDPAAWRNAAIRAEAERLRTNPPGGPVIAAGSTGSIPATAELLKAIAGLEHGAVVLPGFDVDMDAATRSALANGAQDPTVFGHPQFGMAKLLTRIGARVDEVRTLAHASPVMTARARLFAEALRPAASTERWPAARREMAAADVMAGLADVALIEAAKERDEALAIAVALREALETPGAHAALVTPDRALARRVVAELQRFGIAADDSGGTAFDATPAGTMVAHLLEAVFRSGDPLSIVSLLKHPRLRVGMARDDARAAAESLEWIALRGGVGRPDIAALAAHFESRVAEGAIARHAPPWIRRLPATAIEAARRLATGMEQAVRPLAVLRGQQTVTLQAVAEALARSLESLGVDEADGLVRLYEGDAGEALAAMMRSLIAVEADLAFDASEIPEVIAALTAGAVVKPRASASARVSVWGALEARLLPADLLVIGGLNDGVWPRQPDPGHFLSRMMKAELSLDPPERQIGQSAHDFIMAAGAPRIVLSRAARSADAPSVASRWIERLDAFLGPDAMKPLRDRGKRLLDLADALDRSERIAFVERPSPAPPLAARPTRFSVTEVETLRRDPYAIYAKRILALEPLDELIRDPGVAERGSLMHDALARFIIDGHDPAAPDALTTLRAIGRRVFDEAALPPDVEAVWWPRFEKTASGYLDWESSRVRVAARHAEIAALRTPVDHTGVVLGGRADRVDIRADGAAEIIDFKTGSTPSKRQAHTLIAPQLALEAALLKRGAFADLGAREPADLLYVRLKPDGSALGESILSAGSGAEKSVKTGEELADEAWMRLNELLDWFAVAENGYRSRVLPFREGDVEGAYDHLARVLEWSAGGDGPESGEDAS